MKKVSILALHLGYGGIEKSVSSLANILSEKYEVEIACTYKIYDKPVFNLDDRIKIKYLVEDYTPNRKELNSAIKSKNIFKISKEVFKALKILHLRRKTMIDYIKNTDSDVVISTKDIFDRWLGDFGKESTMKVGWEHNHHHNNKQYALNIIRSCQKLDYLVLVSKDLQKFYKKEMLKTKCKCVYIPNVIEKMPPRKATLTEKRLISVGRLSIEKGYIDLLKIFNKVSMDYPDWTLDIIGDGKEKNNLEEYIKKNNLEEKVTLHGFQNKDYIDRLLNKSSIYVMTSHTESFGIVLIEAMSHGVPCIAFSSAEGAKEIIDSGKNGYLIKNRNHSAMIKKIKDLIKSKETRQKIGVSARSSVKKYTSEEVKQQWYNLIEKK